MKKKQKSITTDETENKLSKPKSQKRWSKIIYLDILTNSMFQVKVYLFFHRWQLVQQAEGVHIGVRQQTPHTANARRQTAHVAPIQPAQPQVLDERTAIATLVRQLAIDQLHGQGQLGFARRKLEKPENL